MGDRDVRGGAVGREFAREVAGGDAQPALKDGELAGRVAQDALTDVAALRRLLERVDQRKLGPADWALLRAVLREAEREIESTNKPLRL
jgi:hypothetical protein